MESDERARRLEAIRQAQEAFIRQEQASKPYPLVPGVPPLGAFAEDEPDLHARMATPVPEGAETDSP
ncbi:MAG TPA: hypothetical protein V6D05_05285 [Stenomitos sp.]